MQEPSACLTRDAAGRRRASLLRRSQVALRQRERAHLRFLGPVTCEMASRKISLSLVWLPSMRCSSRTWFSSARYSLAGTTSPPAPVPTKQLIGRYSPCARHKRHAVAMQEDFFDHAELLFRGPAPTALNTFEHLRMHKAPRITVRNLPYMRDHKSNGLHVACFCNLLTQGLNPLSNTGLVRACTTLHPVAAPCGCTIIPQPAGKGSVKRHHSH